MLKILLRKLRSGLSAYVFPNWRLPFMPVVILFQLPRFIVKEVIGNFILSKENPADEFFAFGDGKGIAGAMPWLCKAKMARKYGVFGIAHDDYMGTPVTLFAQPLAVYLLAKLGYRKYVGYAVLLFIVSLLVLAWATGHPWVLLLLPLILCSPYFMEHLYLGNWEILAWSFFVFSSAFWLANLPMLAGLFLTLTIYSHPGIGLLNAMFLTLFALLSMQLYPGFLLVFVISVILTVPYVVPFLRNRSKLGRDKIINDVWKYPYKWYPSTAYQFMVYALFCVAVLYSSPWALVNLTVLLPLVALFVNVKLRWIFSAYTTRSFMLVCGLLFVFSQPNVFTVATFLFVIFTDPHFFISFLPAGEYFNLKPVTLGSKKDKIISLFAKVPARSRIAFEMGKRGVEWEWNVLLGYLLVEEKLEVFNSGFAEIGDYAIYHEYACKLNAQSSKEQLENVCRRAGVSYLVAYSEEFVKKLDSYGYQKQGKITCENMGFSPGKDATMILFELPRRAGLIDPETKFVQKLNEMLFVAEQGQTYTLRYSYFPGWKAFQAGKEIKIVDYKPGMQITALNDGEITLKYNYWNYWK